MSNAAPWVACSTFSLPGISARSCEAAIEAIVSPIAGVVAVTVDVASKTVTVHHDDRAPARRLRDAVEDQGYHTYESPVGPATSTTLHGSHRGRGSAHHAGRRPDVTARATATVSGERADVYAGRGFVDGDGI